MSMTVITALQILWLFVAYSIITILLPHLVVGKVIRFRNGYERFIIYTVLGNFYIINLVYLLELLHISCWFTLFVLTLVPLGYLKVKLESIPFAAMADDAWETMRKLSGGQLKVRALADSGKDTRKEKRKIRRRKRRDFLFRNIPDIILSLCVIVAAFYTFGTNLFVNYGYKLTDVVVHNSWINRLSENEIFYKGVYPFGYHNIIYYIHKIFFIDTYVILRVFNIVVVVWLAFIILAFCKLIFRSKFLPYIAAFAYVLFDYYEYNSYERLCALIPQEYGMVFILPAVYCAFMYFREQRRELNGAATQKTKLYLAGFLMSFSLTLTIHFYATIAAGIYIVAIAIGFAGWLFRKPYFKKVMVTGLLSLFVAILPMGIAYATGTELEYSLKWALSVMSPKPFETNRNTIDTSISEEDEKENEAEEEESTENEPTRFGISIEDYTNRYGKVMGPIRAFYDITVDVLYHSAVKFESRVPSKALLFIFAFLVAAGLCHILTRTGDKIYGGILLSTGMCMVLMTLLLSAAEFGLPKLMDNVRTRVFYALYLGVAVVLAVDCILSTIIRKRKKRYALNAVSLAVLMIVLAAVVKTGGIRKPLMITAFESNDAVTCLTKIIQDTKDRTWTIVSANDEANMVYDHGYHYDLIDFLNEMEIVGDTGRVKMPTPIVYIFLEKYPIDYYISWEGSGTPIDEKYALKPLPIGRTRSIYENENRWILMSRLHYWAEAFENLYPNETSVFYETDKFICYRIEQNPYRLFNFAIDYGYNVPENVIMLEPKK